MKYALGIEYDGTLYKGWQSQRGQNCIQENIEFAISKIANEPVKIFGSGRTDSKVHACCQVAHFETNVKREDKNWLLGINNYLPKDIRILWVKQVNNDFDARRTALNRKYRYIIYNSNIRVSLLRNNVAWIHGKLNADLMQQGANFLLGEHDFSSFRGADCQSISPIRNIEFISVCRKDDIIIFECIGNAFLHHMIRNIMGVLIKIGRGKISPKWAHEVLLAKDRRAADVTADPSGLYYVGPKYPARYNIPDYPDGPWFIN